VATKKPWTIRAFQAADAAGVQKLWAGVTSFDGSVPAKSALEIAARLKHPSSGSGRHWRVALAGNGAIVGALEVTFVGTVRTSIIAAVNPAWRRQGIGRGLLEDLPQDRRILVTTRASVAGADELLSSFAFTERYREARMRRKAKGIEALPLPDGAKLDVDTKRNARRLQAALSSVFGEDAEDDLPLLEAWLARPGCAALYLTLSGKDAGVCLVAGGEHAKRAERTAQGEPTLGVVEQVGLARSLRGKGMSRPLVRAGLVQLARSGFIDLEVTADRRREKAVELYTAEGFTVVDDDVHWMRKEPG